VPNTDTCLPNFSVSTSGDYDAEKDSCCVTLIISTECEAIRYKLYLLNDTTPHTNKELSGETPDKITLCYSNSIYDEIPYKIVAYNGTVEISDSGFIDLSNCFEECFEKMNDCIENGGFLANLW